MASSSLLLPSYSSSTARFVFDLLAPRDLLVVSVGLLEVFFPFRYL